MTALLLIAAAALAAEPSLRVYRELGEVEYRVPVTKFGDAHQGVEIHCIARASDKSNVILGYEKGPFAGGYGQAPADVPTDLPPSKRLTEPVVTQSAIEVRVRFPSQWFNEDDVSIFVKDGRATMTRTVVTKVVTELKATTLASTESLPP